MAYWRRCHYLPAAVAAMLASGFTLSHQVAAQGFRQSITTVSPPPTGQPEADHVQRNRRRGKAIPLPAPAQGSQTESSDIARPGTTDSAPLYGATNLDRSVAPNAGNAIRGSSAVTSDESWRSTPHTRLQPASDALGANTPPSTRLANEGIYPTIPVAPRFSRQRQLRHRFEPYTATGLRVGSFVILPEVEIGLAWSSNVFDSPSARSDHAYAMRPAVRAVSNWRRHAVELRGSSNLSFFDDFRSEDDRSHQLEARGRLDVTRRMNLEALLSHGITQESRGGADATAGATDRADQTTNIAALTFNRRFNRLSVQLRGVVTDFDAAEAEAVNGGFINNDDQDYRELLGALRLAWEFKPTLVVFGELGFGEREHDQAAQSDGLSRSADLRRYRAGLTLGHSRSIWSGEFSIGYGQNDMKDSRLSDVDGVLLDGNLTWRPSALTSLLLTMQSELSATRLAGSGGSRDTQSGLELRHAFRPNLISTTGISYGLRDFDSSSLEEATWLLRAGLEYYLNRNVSVFSRYQHDYFDTNANAGDYRDNSINIGMRLRR